MSPAAFMHGRWPPISGPPARKLIGAKTKKICDEGLIKKPVLPL
jgi:hypothetical protein